MQKTPILQFFVELRKADSQLEFNWSKLKVEPQG
jgi:hypothetical protein